MTTLSPMTQESFERFLERTIPEYAQEKVEAGNWQAEGALQRSRDEFHRLLPDGLTTQKNYLYSLHLERDGLRHEVGVLWLADMDGTGFIFELFVAEAFRHQGVASTAMRLLEGEARRLGLNRLALHVFGHNLIAKRLYEKLGFEITNINMAKSLGD
jgi:ribosomal protein S18 acetylase RimI-like enzyme